MKKVSLLSSLMLGIVVAAGAQSAAAAICKDVKFRVTNNHFEGRDIEIRSVKFRNPHKKGKVQSENVKDKVCKPGATCLTDGDNLVDAEKVHLNDIQVVFRHKNHDGTWSKEFITQPFEPLDRECRKGKQYGPVVVKDSPSSTSGARLSSGGLK